MADTCQPRARRKDLMRTLARSGSNFTIKERRIATRLSKKVSKRNVLISVAFFNGGPTPCSGGLLSCAYGVLEFEPIHNICFGI